jgi:putative spermidine/putrescine transport system substrate-binding protein
MKKRGVVALIGATVALTVGYYAVLNLTRTKPVLTVATWEGDYGHAQRSAQIIPFGMASGVDALFTSYNGGTKELAQQVASRHFDWDVVDMELPDAVAACQSGLLEKIDPSDLPAAPDGTPAAKDFVSGAIGPCWVASAVYSQVIAVAPVKFGDIHPKTLADFFDVQRFAGKRALNRTSAKLNLEMALLADGVAPKDVYEVLSSPQGIGRALKKLDTLRGSLVWYDSPADAAALLRDGRAVMASLPNWAVFDAEKDTPRNPLKNAIIWDRQLYQVEVFGIPRGNPKAKRAMDFVRYATSAPVLGRMTSWIAYGPARRSALAFVGKQPELGLDMKPYLPTAHFATAFQVDDAWWRLHGADVAVFWNAWLTQSDPH